MADIDITTEQVRSLGGDDLVGSCRDVALEINRLQALQASISAQIWQKSEGHSGDDTLTKRYGCRNSVELIKRVTGESAHVVSARLKLGRRTAVRESLVGEQLLPTQEHVAHALESGFLNIDSAIHISKVIEKNSRMAHPEDLDMAERCLVQAATGVDYDTGDAPTMAFHTDDVRRLCVKWDEGLDPDGVAPDDEVRQHRRFLNIGAIKDGMARINGTVTAEVAAALSAIADALNNPRAKTGMADLRTDTSAPDAAGIAVLGSEVTAGLAGGAEVDGADDVLAEDALDGTLPIWDVPTDGSTTDVGPGVDGPGPDPTDDRTPGQKRHDALALALNVALADRDLPVLQGASATIVVEVKEESIVRNGDGDGSGAAWLIDHEGAPTPIPIRSVHGMSCNANIQAVVRDSLGRITGLGSPQRLFTPSQRRAIALRDGGCVIPGCGVPAAWCEVHHVKPHSHGGPTHTDNGVLLCRSHHANIETSGWDIQMRKGIPFVKPPGWLNRLHPDDSRRGWLNHVMADQARQIEVKLARRKRKGKPPRHVA